MKIRSFLFLFFALALSVVCIGWFGDERYMFFPHTAAMFVLLMYYFKLVDQFNYWFIAGFGILLLANFVHYFFPVNIFLIEMFMITISNLILLRFAVVEFKKLEKPFEWNDIWQMPITLGTLGFLSWQMLLASKKGLDDLYIYAIIYIIFVVFFVFFAIINFIKDGSKRHLWLLFTAIGCMVSDFLLSVNLFNDSLPIFVVGNAIFQMACEFSMVKYALAIDKE